MRPVPRWPSRRFSTRSRVPAPLRPRGAELVLSRFQPVRRDFAFVLDSKVPSARLTRAIAGVDKAVIRGVEVFDLYVGPGIADGMKSIAVSVTLQPAKASMTEGEIEALSEKIVAAVNRQTGGTLRAE